ncbi:hypothetical protein SmJEL517_g05757 [Synchytrium microbalum]|uniref:Yippee domain-containing protein n=1 Tax=Synchytrium microbalum TaxID=1806994 RepID=A0A507BZF2_9FUNG|nr:uncharacterized protein SmJEL517_g05757 [Synchytrium microbalum]TPX30735.1 hypothetical protein SmJEL517_g05757 [Synchytrium microbalum]
MSSSDLMKQLTANPAVLAIALGGLAVVGSLYVLGGKPQKPAPQPVEERDTVFLYGFPKVSVEHYRGVNMSPYVTKLELYLRICKVKYVSKLTERTKAPRSKTPYIKYNEDIVGDTSLIIRYLERNGVSQSLDSHLTKEQVAIGTALFSLAEDRIYWATVYQRWQHEPNWAETTHVIFGGMPAPMRYIIANYLARPSAIKQLYGQGFGRFSWEDVVSFADAAIDAVSVYLGSKKYLFGDQISSYDCSVFGMISSILYCTHFPDNKLRDLVLKHKNLVEYCDNIMKAFQGRHGRAYLFKNVENVTVGAKEDRILITGLHTVADINCNVCSTIVGWKYLYAYEETQKYKEDTFIVEKNKISKENNWNASES